MEDQNFKPYTLDDVAKKAGVSKSTTARAIGGYGYVSDDTQSRVIAAAEELEYQPNKLAGSLKSRITKTIGIIVSDIENPFFAKIAREVSEIGFILEYNVLFLNSDSNPMKEKKSLDLLYLGFNS